MVRLLLASAVLLFGAGLAHETEAENLIYSPLNPGLGGNPDLYGYLIGLAEIQNDFAEDSDGGGGFPVIDFPDIDIDLGGGFDDEPEETDETQQE